MSNCRCEREEPAFFAGESGASLYLAVAAARPLSTLRLGTQGGEVRPAGLGMLIEVAATRRPRAQRSPMARDRPYRLPAEEPAFFAQAWRRYLPCRGRGHG
jgi:hypothetical protein